MKKDHSNERGNPLPPQHGLLFSKNRKMYFICTHRQGSTYHGLTYPSRGDWLEKKNEINRSAMRDRSDDTSHYERTLNHGATSHSLKKVLMSKKNGSLIKREENMRPSA